MSANAAITVIIGVLITITTGGPVGYILLAGAIITLARGGDRAVGPSTPIRRGRPTKRTLTATASKVQTSEQPDLSAPITRPVDRTHHLQTSAWQHAQLADLERRLRAPNARYPRSDCIAEDATAP